MGRLILLVNLLLLSGLTVFADEDSSDDLRKIYSPIIQNKTVYIRGKIDSHIYDFLSLEHKALQGVTQVSLNSFGGSTDWAFLIAQKVRGLGLDTVLEEGSVCASACVVIYGSGHKRIMAKSTWLGIHGARLGRAQAAKFRENCKVPKPGLQFVVEKVSVDCREYLSVWYRQAFAATVSFFQVMEAAGVSKNLIYDYFAMGDDPDWAQYNNILKKPDLVLTAAQARAYNLATEVF